jgi:hypothetical protein
MCTIKGRCSGPENGLPGVGGCTVVQSSGDVRQVKFGPLHFSKLDGSNENFFRTMAGLGFDAGLEPRNEKALELS